MKRLLWISLLLLGTLSVNAQFKTGGMGYFSFGGDFHPQPELQANLEATWPSVPSTAGFGIGGGGFSLFKQRGILIGHGFGSRFATLQSREVYVRQHMGGGGIGLGYAILNQQDRLLFPSLQFCGMGQTLVLENSNLHPRYFGDEMLDRGETQTYETGFFYLDMALQLQQLFRLGGSGAKGVSVGLSLGYRHGLSRTGWSRAGSDASLPNLEPQGLSGMYFRIHIGGGGFGE